MRQAGVLAAACLISLEKMTKRLHEDHAHARLIAEELARHGGVSIDLNAIQTNIIRFAFRRENLDGARLGTLLRERGILVDARGGDKIRMVTHNDVSAKDTHAIVSALREILG